MPASTFEIRGALTRDEMRAANELMARTQAPSYRESLGWLEGVGATWPGHGPGYTRIVVDGGRVIGALRLITLTLRFGAARVRAGGIGWVSTDTAHRNRGVCTALMHDTLAFMHREGFALSLLYGIPNLYERFGYVSCIPEHSVTVEITLAPRLRSSPVTSRPIYSADIPVVQRMHDAHETTATCSIVRDRALLRSQFADAMAKTPYWCDWPRARMLLDARGRPQAYYMPQRADDELRIKDLAVTTPESCETLLRATCDAARAKRLGRVRFYVPAPHPFARYLETVESLHETRHFTNREGMIALVDARRCVDSLAPEWDARVRERRGTLTPAEITIDVEGTVFGLRWDARALAVHNRLGRNRVTMSSQDFVYLATGYVYAEDLLRRRAPKLPADARALAETVFAKRAPFIWPIDRF